MNLTAPPFDPATRLPLLYVAGPYSTGDPVMNTQAAMDAAGVIVSSGAAIPVVPHLSMLWHLYRPQEIDFWYQYDLHLLGACDALVRLPGHSTGADKEVEVAASIGLAVFTEVDAAIEWCRALP